MRPPKPEVLKLYLRKYYRYCRNFNGKSWVNNHEELERKCWQVTETTMDNRKWLGWRPNWYISISGCVSLSKLLEHTFIEHVSVPLSLVCTGFSDMLCLSVQSVIQMTTMCLSASICFLICITPSIILLIGKPYWNKPSTERSYQVLATLIRSQNMAL